MKRRSFIKHAAHSLAIPSFLGAMSNKSFGQTLDKFLHLANETDRALVLIYLEGGNDGLNTVIPMAHLSQLNKVRPHVVLPESGILPVEGTDFGLHPSLSGFQTLYEEGRLQVLHSVGYPQQNFSHFRSTDIWMSGSDSDELINSGWTGRYLEAKHPQFPEGYPNGENPDPLAVEIGYGSSMLFQGEKAGFSMIINNTNQFYQLLDNEQEETPDTPAGDKLRYIRLIAEQSQKYGAVVRSAAQKVPQQKVYPNTRLGNQLRVVSRLIAGGLKTPLYLVRMGGFDTHDNQVDGGDHTQGEHARLLKDLNDAVMAFMADQEFLGTADRVMGMTFSEFGRRIVSNSSGGTDHGASAPLFIFGNMSYGGYKGNAPLIDGSEEYRDNIPMQHDFRQVYSSLLTQWFGSDASVNQATMMGTFGEIPVVKNALITSIEKEEPSNLKVYPNPIRDFATVKFDVFSGNIRIDIIDSQGREVKKIYEGMAQNRQFNQNFDFSMYPPGRYILRVMDGFRRSTVHLIKL
jgi:uncharacterized protein (DUF1501 family)